MSDTKNSTLLGWAAMITAIGGVLGMLLTNRDKIWPPEYPKPAPDTVLVPAPYPNPNPGSIKSPSSKSSPAGHLIRDTASGQVVDDNGQPVAGLKIRCTDCLTLDQVAITDADGNFSLPFQIQDQGNDIQDIHLSVSGRKHLYSVRVADPHGLHLEPSH